MLPDWETLLETARWSPSPHNVQSWKVKVRSASEADIYIDKSRTFPILDTTGNFIVLGMALFIEMLDITARNYGAELKVTYNPVNPNKEKSKLIKFASVHLYPSKKKPAYDKQLIVKRRTSRLPYDGRKVSPKILRRLSSIAASYGSEATFTQDPADLQWALQLNAQTVFYDYRIPQARKELAKWTRSSMRSARKHRDGLAAYAMNVPRFIFWAFFHTNGILALPPFKQLLFSSYLRSMSGTTTLGWIEGDFTSFNGAVNCGKLLAHLWLELTKNNLCLHPYGSMITNKQAKSEFKEHFHIEEKDEDLWLILRIGRSKTPARSMRLAVEDILL